MADSEIKSSGGVIQMVNCGGGVQTYGCGCGGSGGGDGGGDGGGGGDNGGGSKVGDEQFNATCKDGKVVLTWKAGDAFKLLRDGQLLKEGTTETTYTDTVTDDKYYVYKLEQGTASKSLTVNPKTLCQASENPDDPKKLNLKAVCDNNKVKLTWDDLTGSDGKKAHYNVSPGQNDLIVNYYVTDLTAGQQKSFTVSAFDSSNKPLASEILDLVYDQVCVPPPPDTGCDDPTQVEEINVYSSSTFITWTRGESEYIEGQLEVIVPFKITGLCGFTAFTRRPGTTPPRYQGQVGDWWHSKTFTVNGSSTKITTGYRELNNTGHGTWETGIWTVKVVRDTE